MSMKSPNAAAHLYADEIQTGIWVLTDVFGWRHVTAADTDGMGWVTLRFADGTATAVHVSTHLRVSETDPR